MITIIDELKNVIIKDKLAIALGTFDGIHLGHKKIISTTVEIAKERNLKSAVFTFDNHPHSVLFPNKDINLLTPNREKEHIFSQFNIDYLIMIKFNEVFSQISAEDFIYSLSNLNPAVLICGYNYTFGKKALGNTELLMDMGKVYGYDLKVVDRVLLDSIDVSSTSIREKLIHGNVSEANQLLGHNYFSIGNVTKGKQLANKLGFPTANIFVDEMICIPNGVYLTLCTIDGISYPAISNVGYVPTFNQKYRSLETHILNFDQNIYGKEIKVEYVEFLRKESRFESIDELKKMVLLDIKKAQKYFNISIYN